MQTTKLQSSSTSEVVAYKPAFLDNESCFLQGNTFFKKYTSENFLTQRLIKTDVYCICTWFSSSFHFALLTLGDKSSNILDFLSKWI